MRASLFFPVAIAALVVTASSASAQALGDVAKREELRRSAVPKPSKTYSNAELKADFTAPPAPVDAQPSAAPSSTSTPRKRQRRAPPWNRRRRRPSPWKTKRPGVGAPERFAPGWRRHRKWSMASPPNARDDPREQARTDELIKRAQDELRRAVDAQRLLEMQADVAGMPVAWIK